MEVSSFALDPVRNTPLIILKESGGERTLSVPIGHAEASAIAMKSLNVVTDKPLTVDLVKMSIEALGGAVERVVVDDAGEQGLQTRLHVVSNRSVNLIECSTSDGISLALRCSAPIFATEQVFKRRSGEGPPSPQEQLRRSIAATDTIDFGTYYLE